jgi:hypothetical protein
MTLPTTSNAVAIRDGADSTGVLTLVPSIIRGGPGEGLGDRAAPAEGTLTAES